MQSPSTTIHSPEEFAVSVVRQLRGAGFEALWAGGCVRDQLLGMAPKDYDVATTATPEQVIQLFGKRRTVPVGISFGVVMVLGPQKSCGQIEVATFRADGNYLDGRRPQDITYCSAEEDAKRRDFTINGMFYDPLSATVLDYVGGQQDLAAGLVRAIGDPVARFTEDKLRMLRAVRFAATFQFQLDAATAQAICELRTGLRQVSAERIAQELRRMLSHATRAESVQWLRNTQLLEVIFPELTFSDHSCSAASGQPQSSLEKVLQQLTQPTFEPAMAVLFQPLMKTEAAGTTARTSAVRDACRNLKLSNQETDTVCWILASSDACTSCEQPPLHIMKPILADQRRSLVIDFLRATAESRGTHLDIADFLQEYAGSTPQEVLDPPPLVSGADLKALNQRPGPLFQKVLKQIRTEQLDEHILDRDSAILRLQQLVTEAEDK